MADRIFVFEEVEKAEALAVARLEAHITPGEHHYLTDVKTFYPGFEYVGGEGMPLLAAAATIARPASARGSSAFSVPWEMTMRFRAVVDHDDPVTARREARELAGRAMHSLTTNPDTGEVEWSLDDPADSGISYRLDFSNYELIVGPGRSSNVLEARSAMTVRFDTSY